MPLFTFFWADIIPCLLSNTLLYTLGYISAKQGSVLLPYLKTVHIVLFGLFALVVVSLLFWRRRRLRT